jgi:flagellar biosynthesis/type III secretory pathway protein FliH
MRFDQWFMDFFNTLVYFASPDTVQSHKAAYEAGYKQGGLDKYDDGYEQGKIDGYDQARHTVK